MQVLLTNDDGIDAPGLDSLAQVVATFDEPVVIAPSAEVSECGHAVTTKRALSLGPRAANRFSLDGTPADCVRIGLASLCPGAEWVLSGLNDGANLGVDIYVSGTVAAAREAALSNRRAIAFSQFRRADVPKDWALVARCLQRVLRHCQGRPLRPGTFWNVNLPAMEELQDETPIVECPLDRNPLPVDYAVEGGRYRFRGVYLNRQRTPGSDVDVCFSGRISLTRIRLFCE